MAGSKADVSAYDRSVFVNCPFDREFQPLFRALLFTIADCGFLVRCALEVEDSGEVRANKIIRIIKECVLGIHDISRTELNPEGLPRFNMPYELGLFIGCAAFGSGKHKTKKALILDKERYRFAKYLSDIAGQDIQSHGNDVAQMIKKVRNWLASVSAGEPIPGGDTIHKRFTEFCADLPQICGKLHLVEAGLDNFRDFQNCVEDWLIAKKE
jgi:hypothetical protein